MKQSDVTTIKDSGDIVINGRTIHYWKTLDGWAATGRVGSLEALKEGKELTDKQYSFVAFSNDQNMNTCQMAVAIEAIFLMVNEDIEEIVDSLYKSLTMAMDIT